MVVAFLHYVITRLSTGCNDVVYMMIVNYGIAVLLKGNGTLTAIYSRV